MTGSNVQLLRDEPRQGLPPTSEALVEMSVKGDRHAPPTCQMSDFHWLSKLRPTPDVSAIPQPPNVLAVVRVVFSSIDLVVLRSVCISRGRWDDRIDD